MIRKGGCSKKVLFLCLTINFMEHLVKKMPGLGTCFRIRRLWNILHNTLLTSFSTTGELNLTAKHYAITQLGSPCRSNCWNRPKYEPTQFLIDFRKHDNSTKINLVSASTSNFGILEFHLCQSNCWNSEYKSEAPIWPSSVYIQALPRGKI